MTNSTSSSLKGLILGLFSFVLILGSADVALGAPPIKQQSPGVTSANFQASVTREVRHELVMLPFYSVFDNLQYQVQGDKVVLMGQVVQPNLKDDAEKAVKSVEGVTAVDNRIEVLPTSIEDDRIRNAEYRAIYSFPTLQMYAVRSVPPIHISVNNGHVTLEGSVAKEADKDAANVRANTVPNVFSVTNNLRVDNGN